MNSENNGYGFGWYLSAFALGTAVGVTVALLTAPRPGRETRERLKKAALDMSRTVGQVPAAIQKATDRAVRAAESVMGQARGH